MPLLEPDALAERISSDPKHRARVLGMLEWNNKMVKESNGPPKDHNDMSGRELLLKIMELTAAKETTDYDLQEILDAIERILSARSSQ